MAMNPNYTEFKFPQIKPHPWHKVTVRQQSAKSGPDSGQANIWLKILDKEHPKIYLQSSGEKTKRK